MNDTTDKDGKKLGGTLTLKRPALEQSRVKQSFSHGRTKTVVVETKRKRFGEDVKPAAPVVEQRQGFQQKPKVAAQDAAPPSTTRPSQPSQPAQSRAGVVLRTLTADEREARERALADARVREAQERKRQEEDLVRRKAQEERDRIEREAAARRKAEDDARHQFDEQGGLGIGLGPALFPVLQGANVRAQVAGQDRPGNGDCLRDALLYPLSLAGNHALRPPVGFEISVDCLFPIFQRLRIFDDI